MTLQTRGVVPKDLVVGEGFVNPVGFHDATPSFSWKLPVGVEKQTAYQIEVSDVLSEQVVWDSGWVESEQSTLVPFNGSVLESRQQLNWRIRFRDEAGMDSDWSASARFELGLLSAADWTAQWIHATDLSAEAYTLVQATYRSVSHPSLNADVTSVVMALVSAQTWEVSNDALGGDPAPNEVKELQLIYTEGGIEKSITFDEGAFAALPSSECTLVQGIYRSKANPAHFSDVTLFLRHVTFTVNTAVLGVDPAPNEAKEIELIYTQAGIDQTFVYAESQLAALPLVSGALEPIAALRREFLVSGAVTRARLYVTARGLFDVRLNGQKVGADYFANGWTSYDKRLDTLTYDVTSLLTSGENRLGAMLGMGWYAGRLAWNKSYYGVTPELLLQLEITKTDGSTQTIVSDGTWEGTFDGPVVSSSIYDGETYDARKADFADAQWLPVVADANLGSAQLAPKPFAPVRVTETLPVQQITEPETGRFVFDLGQNMVGWAKITIPVQADQTVKIRFAEMLNPDGTMYTANYRSAISTDYYTAAETGTIEWEPVFTFHGFRYVELSGFPAGVTPDESWVTGVVLHSDLTPIGTFESSHAKLNQLQRNIVWGQRGNFLDIPTDCPQRDERLGWTGDAQAFCATALFNYDCHAFFKSWLSSMRQDQKSDGQIPHVIPDVLNGDAGSPGWMDAATIIPWEVYVRTGDLEMLSENYAMMERLVGWYRSKAINHRIISIDGFGDWLQPYASDNWGDTSQALLGTAFYAHSVQILADSARVLGKMADAQTYATEANNVKNAFAAYYFNSTGKLQNTTETQTAYLLAIEFDLIPVALQELADDHLVALVHAANNHLRTGFLGTPYIAKVLDQTEHADVAYSVLFKETYPSWFYSINQGATTMWERWNSYSNEDGFGDVIMNSFNHYAYGAINQWMVERVAGLSLDPEHPGYKHFFVHPVIGGPLTSAHAELETPYGTASSAWEIINGMVVMDVVVPPNTTATIEFPMGRNPETVSAGTHHFELVYGPIAHWDLDEGTGTVVRDATGNGYTGTILNGASWASDATRDSFLSFDGEDDRISTQFTYALSSTDNFTWAWWAKQQSTGTADDQAIMIGNRYPEPGAGGDRYEFIKFTPKAAEFANTTDASSIDKVEYAHTALGEWHHYAMVKTETSYQWHVDGVAQGSPVTINYSEENPLPLFIGGDGAGVPDEHFQGFIDDVVLYTRALTQAEVVAVKNGFYGGTSSEPPELNIETIGDDFSFSWTDSGFKLQTLTNGLMSGEWFDYSGGSISPVNVTPSLPSAFFRLVPQ